MSNGPIRLRSSDVEHDHNVHRISLAVHEALNMKYGMVCGPFNMLHDYTEDDMEKAIEAGRQRAIEREKLMIEALLGAKMEPVSEEPIPLEKNPYGDNRKARRALKAKKRKKDKAVKKLIKKAKSLIK